MNLQDVCRSLKYYMKYVLQIHIVHANVGDKYSVYFSISTLLEHSAAQPTEFLLKIWCGSNSFLIQLAVTWVSWVKNQQKFEFQSWFSTSKISLIILKKKTCENVRLGEQLVLVLFFDNFNFWKSLFLKLGLNFVVSYSSSIKKLFDPHRLIYIL